MRILFLLFILSTFISCSSSELFFEDAICIEHVTTIDPIEGEKSDQTIIIKDGKIFKLAKSSSLKLAPNNTIIDGTGKYLIPGLWDAHVHFAYMETLAPGMFNLFLAYGITSVRDTGGKIEFVKKWKAQAEAEPTKAPRVKIAGPLLDGEPNVYDGSAPNRPPLSVGLENVEALEKQVEFLDKNGVDLLKAYEMLSPAQFKRVGALAKEKGLPLTGHVPLSMDVISASNAGLNSMEHLRNLELSCASNSDILLIQRLQLLENGQKDPGGILRSRIHQAQREIAVENFDPERADSVLAVLAKNQTWQIPTLALNTGLISRHFEDPEWQETFVYLPDSIQQLWTKGVASMKDRALTEFNKTYSDWMFNMLGRVHKADIPIMAGTDCPIFFLTPGRSLHQELQMLVKAGLSPLEALKTATYNPAKYFNLEKELGSIKTNHWADLLLLDANPLENISNTLAIQAVFRQGTYYDRTSLNQLLEDLKSRY